jgi:hypothetical protein
MVLLSVRIVWDDIGYQEKGNVTPALDIFFPGNLGKCQEHR